MPGDIIIRIGAAQDRSIDAVFDNIDRRSTRAFGAVRRESGNASKSMVADARTAAAEEKRAADARLKVDRDIYREQSRLNRMILAEQIRAGRLQGQEAARMSRERTRERLKGLQEEERAERQYNDRVLRMKIQAQREANRAQRAEERSRLRDSYRQEREIDRFATRTSHRATRFFFPRPEGALGYTKRIAGDLMRGAGVDFSLSGGVGRARERESAAVALSNQGWMPGQGEFKDRISAKSLRATAGGIATKYAVDETEVLAGMSKFTDVTGDLETAQKSMESIVLLAKASGTAIEDAASASADMSMQLGDIPDKAQVLANLMGVAAMGGKQGAVEIKDLAKYVPQIVAYAGSMTGDRATNMGKLLAITQTARQYGGAGNAAIAATATAGLMNTLQTPSRVKEFEGHFAKFTGGHSSVYNKEGQLRPIDEILLDSIKAAGTGKYRQVEFKKMWANVKGGKAATGFMNIYDQAEEKAKKEAAATGAKFVPGKAGEAAYWAQFGKFTKGVSAEDQAKMAAEALETVAGKAQAFQKKLDDVTEQMAAKLFPALQSLEQPALRAANAMSGLVTWAASNPWKAVFAGAGVSIGRALTESAGRYMLEQNIKNLSTPISQITGGGAVAGLAGAVALGAASFMITTAVLNAANVEMQQEKKTASEQYNKIVSDFSKEYADAKTPEDRETAIKRARQNMTHTLEAHEGMSGSAELYEATQKAFIDAIKNAGGTGEKPWAPGDLAPAQGKQAATAEEIGRNVAIAMGTKELKISGWDMMLDALAKMGGNLGSGGVPMAPPSFTQ